MAETTPTPEPTPTPTLPTPLPTAGPPIGPPATQIVWGATYPNAPTYTRILVNLNQIVAVIDRGKEYEVHLRDELHIWIAPTTVISPMPYASPFDQLRADQSPQPPAPGQYEPNPGEPNPLGLAVLDEPPDPALYQGGNRGGIAPITQRPQPL